MKSRFTLLFAVAATHVCVAQRYAVKGSVADTLNFKALHRSSITIIRSSDSVIESHTRAGIDGGFRLTAEKPGRYMFRISYPGFADYTDILNIKDTLTDLGQVAMISREHLLKEVVVTRQVGAIKIKGDTTEYMADSFRVKDNANVEDLLKKLPGIQVDKNGQITAQGETVQKILVDGEEFFSDDPKVVTQGLQANSVEKVQVFDKKSDQAEFTGIDDGQKTKTINLELKENKKKGYFGKVDAGAGTDGYFQNQGMINAFKGKRQISVFGILSNTDKVGLGWQDNDKFGGGNGETEITDDGTWMMTGGTYDEFGGWNGNYSGEGLPKVWTGGAHYADKWNEDKQHVSGNYRYARQNVEIDGDNISQNALGGDTTRVSHERKNQFSEVERNGFDALYEWKMDSSSSLKFTANVGEKKSDVYSLYNTETYFRTGDADGAKTTSQRQVANSTLNQFINTDLLYRRKFAKKGRTVSLDVKENYRNNTGAGHLNATTVIPGSGTDIIDQKKINDNNTLAFSTTGTYTEPISKNWSAEAKYGLSVNNSESLIYSYDKPTGGTDYSSRNDTFSSDYKYDVLENHGGMKFRYNYKKVTFSFGGEVSNTGYLQTDILHGDTSHRYSYTNFFPQANFVFKVGRQTSFNVSYSGSTKQPTITQVQPLRQNTDPLNITIGDPGLRQQFTHNINIHYNDYKVLTNRYIYASLYGTFTQDAITTSQEIDGPVSTTKYVNGNGKYSIDGYISCGYKLKKPEMNIRMMAQANTNHTNGYVDGRLNSSDNNSYTFGPEFLYEKDDKFDFSVSPEATYNHNTATINVYATDYWVFKGEFKGSVQLPGKFALGTSVDVMLRQKTAVFTDNNQVVKWNAYASKKLGKKKDLEIKASVFDILNQNIGYSRVAQGNTITQNSYNTIRRYAMLSVAWTITHTPAAIPADQK